LYDIQSIDVFFGDVDLLCSPQWLLWVKWLGLFFS